METGRIEGMRELSALVAFVFVLFCAGTTVAMPSQKELSEAQPIVNELMGPFAKDYKAKKKTAAEVGDRAMEFVAEANTQAAKFVLLKGAVHYYALAKEYDKSADAIESIMKLVPDLPPKMLYEITSKAVSSAAAKTASRLVDLNMSAKNRMTVATRLKAIEKDLKSTPADLKLVRMHAELTAAAGDWESALAEFAKLGGEIGQMAKAESESTGTSAELADFWWSYKPTVGEAKDSIREHAASLYRKAMDNGELDGLKKAVAEKRIAEVAVENLRTVFETKPMVEYKFSYSLDKKGNAMLRGQPCVSPNPEGVLIVPKTVDGHKVVATHFSAFRGCDKLTRIFLPDTIEYMGGSPFIGATSLDSIEIAKTNPYFVTIDGAVYTRDRKELQEYPKTRDKIKLVPGVVKVRSDVFASCKFKEAIIPEGITTINEFAFVCCPNLEVVEFPKSLTSVGGHLFGNSPTLKKIVFHGDAPRFQKGHNPIAGSAPDVVIYVKKGAKGWAGQGMTNLPERWPLKGDSRPIRYIQ